MNNTILSASLATLLGELVDGPPKGTCFVLNKGDVGLLRSLDKLSSDAASQSSLGGASIAAHADHVRYYMSLLNGWAGRNSNPWANADWSQSWRITKVSDAEWQRIREGLGRELRQWQEVFKEELPELTELELNGAMASIVHLAYHLGAMRQIDRAVRGPKEDQ